MATQGLVQDVEIVSQADGSTDIVIPAKYMWECVECLGENRMPASYRFAPPHFVAHVTAASPQRVRETLQNWKLPQSAE